MKIADTEIKVIKGDITELEVDAIVNPANGSLTMEAGLAALIKKKGGAEIEVEAGTIAPLSDGHAAATSAGKLKTRWIIHAVTMKSSDKTDETTIRFAAASSLRCAQKLKISSLALPALGCGVGRFSVIGAAKIMAQEVLKYCRGRMSSCSRPCLQEIIFCLHDDKTFSVFEKNVYAYLRHVVETLGAGPYATVDIIIELKEGIVVIERSNPPYGLALPGGFVDYGEALEAAAAREAREETNLAVEDLRQFHTYSDPGRDPRFHTISTVFIGRGRGTPQSGDDAKSLKVVPCGDLLKCQYAFDHRKVIEDYIECGKNTGRA